MIRVAIFCLILLPFHYVNGQVIKAEQTWAANSGPGRGNEGKGFDCFPSMVTSLIVASDGTVLTHCAYDECHNHTVVWKDGKFVARARHMIGEGWGGGTGVAASRGLIFLVQSFEKQKGRNPDHDPPNGAGISFRDFSLRPVRIPNGKGGGQRNQKGSYLPVVNTSTGNGFHAIGGIAAQAQSSSTGEQVTLYVSDKVNQQIRRYSVSVRVNGNNVQVDRVTAGKSWSVPTPGPVAVDDKGNVWVGSTVDDRKSGKVIGYSSSGQPIGREYALEHPAAGLAVHDCELWVANHTVPMPVFDLSSDSTVPKQQWGKSLDDTKGRFTKTSVPAPRAVGLDGKGNVYTVSNLGTGTSRLSVHRPDGELIYEKHAVAFAMCGGLTADGEEIYTVVGRLKRNGSRWDLVGHTQNAKLYPQDRRPGVHFVRVFERDGHRFVYMFSTDDVRMYRVVDGSEYLKPVGYFQSNFSKLDRLFDDGQKGNLLWQDGNGDGTPQRSECRQQESSVGTLRGFIQGFHLDSSGGLTFGLHGRGLGRMEIKSVTRDGVLVYGDVAIYSAPGLGMTIRAVQNEKNGHIYATGFSADVKRADGRLCGNLMCCYRLNAGMLEAVWTQKIPYGRNGKDQLTGIESLHIPRSGDVMFLGDRMSSNIYVHSPESGERIGMIERNRELFGSWPNWLDVTDAVDSVKLSDGRYRVITENVSPQGLAVYTFRLPK